MKWFALLFLLTFTAGCASREPYMLPESDPEASPMMFRKGMPDRRDAKPWEFYYKHCTETDSRAYYSKTSYDCNGPYY